MTSLTPSMWQRIQEQTPRLLQMPTRQIVDTLIGFSQHERIPLPVIVRTVAPLRDELRRRELRGIDDPFDSIHDPVSA